MEGIFKRVRFLEKTDRNLEKSQLLLKEVSFLEKRPNEFAKEPASWKKHGRNSKELASRKTSRLFFAIHVIFFGEFSAFSHVLPQ